MVMDGATAAALTDNVAALLVVLPATLLTTTVNRAPLTELVVAGDRKSTRLNSSHGYISYAVFCLKKKNIRLHAFLALTVPPHWRRHRIHRHRRHQDHTVLLPILTDYQPPITLLLRALVTRILPQP